MASALAFSEDVLRGVPPITCVFWRVPPCMERVFEQKWAGFGTWHAAKERASKRLKDDEASKIMTIEHRESMLGWGRRTRSTTTGRQWALYTLDIQ